MYCRVPTALRLHYSSYLYTYTIENVFFFFLVQCDYELTTKSGGNRLARVIYFVFCVHQIICFIVLSVLSLRKMAKRNGICKRILEKSEVTKVKKADFELNEVVFAKMTRYPAWPGIISEIGRTIKVYFFGSNNWYVSFFPFYVLQINGLKCNEILFITSPVVSCQ